MYTSSNYDYNANTQTTNNNRKQQRGYVGKKRGNPDDPVFTIEQIDNKIVIREVLPSEMID